MGQAGVLVGVIGKTSGTFARCGVTLGAAEVVTVKWSAEGLKRLNDDNPYHGPAQMGVMGEEYNADSVDRFKPRFPAAAGLPDTFWIAVDERGTFPVKI